MTRNDQLPLEPPLVIEGCPSLKEIERRYFQRLEAAEIPFARIARILGLSRTTLYRRLRGWQLTEQEKSASL